MADICNLEGPLHRLIVGLDMLNDLIIDLECEGVDVEVHARAWFVVQALKTEASATLNDLQGQIARLPKPWITT